MNRLLNFNLLNKLKYKKNKCQINHCKFLYLIYIYNLLILIVVFKSIVALGSKIPTN